MFDWLKIRKQNSTKVDSIFYNKEKFVNKEQYTKGLIALLELAQERRESGENFNAGAVIGLEEAIVILREQLEVENG